jgi:hypothetical protein
MVGPLYVVGAPARSSSGFRCEANGYAKACYGRAEPFFSMPSRVAPGLHMLARMHDNNNLRSGYLGPLVVMGTLPIVIYMLVWFVLPWLAKG